MRKVNKKNTSKTTARPASSNMLKDIKKIDTKVSEKNTSKTADVKKDIIEIKDSVLGFIRKTAQTIKALGKKYLTRDNFKSTSYDSLVGMAWLNVAAVAAVGFLKVGVLTPVAFISIYKIVGLSAFIALAIFVAIQIGFGIAKVVSFLNEAPAVAVTVKA